MTSQDSCERLDPNAAMLIESMRDVGYTLEAAIGDIIDNSIAAQARRIDIYVDDRSGNRAVAIVDDGCGMDRDTLRSAMRAGAKDPLETRTEKDLGRFGLGLKTASFSQCRRLTVASRRSGGEIGAAVWDLDFVRARNAWMLQWCHDLGAIRFLNRLPENGTLVLWEEMDRWRDATLTQMNKLLRAYIGLTFGDYLHGPGAITITLNEQKIERIDPFCATHSATQRLGEEVEFFRGGRIVIQPFVLPREARLDHQNWETVGGLDGHIRNQGFYLYRNRRLLIHGTWFGLLRPQDSTKLARIRIDIGNTTDADWRIDIKKASASPPHVLRDRLRKLATLTAEAAKRTHFGRTWNSAQPQDRHPAWLRSHDRKGITYGLHPDHPLRNALVSNLNPEQKKLLAAYLNCIEQELPIDNIRADIEGTALDVRPSGPRLEEIVEAARIFERTLIEQGYDREVARSDLQNHPMFAAYWSEIENALGSV